MESLHLMNETLTTHRFSRNGPVNREVSATLSRMDMGKDVTKVWQRLDEHLDCIVEFCTSSLPVSLCRFPSLALALALARSLSVFLSRPALTT